MAQAVVPPLPPRLVVLVVMLVPLTRQQQRRRRRVRRSTPRLDIESRLTHHTEKEESDDDMGFGLFD